MNRNNEDYRSPAIPALTKTLLEDIKQIFKTTTGTPFLIPTTGTASIGVNSFKYHAETDRFRFQCDAFQIPTVDMLNKS
ncbi:hypothetical protein ACSBR1_022162 [Camellia fascicularis]